MTSQRFWRGVSALCIGLLVLAIFAIYWLFYDNSLSSARSFKLDLAAIRAESSRIPGAVPDRVEVEVISFQRMPRIVMLASADWAPVDLIRTSYRLVWPDHSIIIDTGHDEKAANATGADVYFRPAWQRLQTALTTAQTIIVTHEHGDHLGGITASPALAAIAPHSLLLPEQAAKLPAKVRAAVQPLRYVGLKAIAPGVVLIRAAGHTPGSQMIYVRRADGHEYIFMGDTASLAGNVATLKARSRLVSDFIVHEDRRAVLGQLLALNRLAVANPDLTLVPGHDGDDIGKIISAGWLSPRFVSLPTPPSNPPPTSPSTPPATLPAR